MKILNVVGARPNFMKVAPLHRAFQNFADVTSKIVHTGQHYDAQMSDVFFRQLNLPQPDYSLNVGNGTVTEQTATILLRFEKILRQEKPDWVLVVGDVTSTLACALGAVQMGVRVAHVEAGLRSGDRQMPEEINRCQTDQLSDLLFITEYSACQNLLHEGVRKERIHFVGNVMIDSLLHYRASAASINNVAALGLKSVSYAFITMHRPVNVDTFENLERIVDIVTVLAEKLPVVWPLHPRTRANLLKFNLFSRLANIAQLHLLEPQGYLETINFMEYATVVLTDSGGIQEETTYLQVPCLTLRNATERPVTIEMGTNQLIPELDAQTVYKNVLDILEGRAKPAVIPPLWDGRAAERIAEIIKAN
ncbi:O-antigen biosynthesis protein WlbD [Spirosoma daeguense]